jgi:hypothetical protein
MANAISVVNDARYDLKDYGTGVNIENVELLNYLNRVIRIFGKELCRVNSEYTHTSTSTSTSASTAYIAAPSTAHHIRSVWIGTDKLTHISSNEMDEKRKWYDISSAQAKPQYWCHRGANILFQQQPGQDASSADWVCTIHSNNIPAAITSIDSSAMPWASHYDDHLIQSLVFYTRAKKDDTMENPDAAIAKMARQMAVGEYISRNNVRKGYYIDF